MSKPISEQRFFQGGGMDSDTSLDSILQPDYIEAFMFQTTGNVEGEFGDGTNIASTVEVAGYTLPPGINKCIGAEKFENVRKAYFFIYNSFGFHQLGEFDPDLNVKTLLFTNLTDSGGIDVLPLTVTNYINSIKLVNNGKLSFTDGNIEVGDISIPRLKSGGYGVITSDDFRLIKAQPLKIPTAVYNDDAGRVVNLLKDKLFQFRYYYTYLDFEQSALSAYSKRPVPTEEATTAVGEDVTKNNNLIVTIDIGTNRVSQIDIASRYSLLDDFTAKSVTRDYVLSLPNTTIDISQEIYEAYNPASNTYSFVFYYDQLYINIDPTVSDLPYDYVPQKAASLELVNGDIIALANITEGYQRPVVDINFTISNYNPNLSIGTEDPNLLKVRSTASSTKKASHARSITVTFIGSAKTGDEIHITTADIRNTTTRRMYEYTVEPIYNNNTLGALQKMASTYMPNVGVSVYPQNDYFVMQWVDFQYYDIQTAYIVLSSVGTGEFSSIHALKSNSAYQAALQYYDRYGRTFPLLTGDNYIFKTDSYAQSKGLSPRLTWQINSDPPIGAVSYHLLLSLNNTHQTTLFVNCNYISTDGNYIILNLNPLKTFNARNSSSILNYQYSPGDRVAFHYYDDHGTIVWFDDPFIDVQVVDFTIVTDPTTDPVTITWKLKVRLNTSLNLTAISNNNIYIEIYTPKSRVSVSGETTTYLTTLFYEIGEQYNIIDGAHEKTSGVITDGDVFFKTRDLVSAVDGTTYNTYLAEDFNFSDLYESKYTSYGRGFLYNQRDGIKVRQASIRYSDTFDIDSTVSLLNRFYGERLYGEGDGQTSSSYGAIRKIRQRGNYIVCLQEIVVCHIPVFSTIVEDQAGQTQSYLSDQLFNKVRYSEVGLYGMSNSPECYCESPNGTIYFFDTGNSIPMREGLDGLMDISRKMSKFFKRTIHQNKQLGRDTIAYWNNYTKEAVFSTQVLADGVIQVPIVDSSFEYEDDYTIIPSDAAIVTQATKGTIAFTGGQWIYTPNQDAIGSDSFTFSFVINGTTIVKKYCGVIQPGISNINPFTFVDLTNQPLSTVVYSNIILITGNNIPSPIGITGGEYQINSGPYTSVAGVVNNGDQVTVRQTTSSTAGTSTHAILTIAGYSDSFDAMTTMPVVINDFTYTNYYGRNPYTQAGFSLLKNGVSIVVQPDETSNNLNGVFTQGDEITFINTSKAANFPWAVGSSSVMLLKVNDTVIFNNTASPQSDTLQTYVLDTDISTVKIELFITGQSTAIGQLTKLFDTYLFYNSQDKLSLTLVDTTDNLSRLNVTPVIQGNEFLFNYINDANSLTLNIINNTSGNSYVYVEGASYASGAITVPGNTTIPITGIPKDRVYLFDLEFNGYVRRGDFTRNNCPSGQTGGVVPFAKAYTDSAAAAADTVNFNNLGQARANMFGTCTI